MAPWCNNGEHARSMLRDSKLVETILEVDISEDGIVGNAIYVESNIRKWSMVGNDAFIDDPEITTNTNIWCSGLGGDSDVGSNRGSRRD